MQHPNELASLVGQTISCIEIGRGRDELIFILADGRRFRFWHESDCCESVSIEDISGDLSDLIGSPLTKAEEVISNENPDGYVPGYQDSFTWTYYHFATVKGYMTVRWYGESNGYYSESVDYGWVK